MMELPKEIRIESGEQVKTVIGRKYDSWIFPAIIFFAIILIITPIIMIMLNTYSPMIYMTLFPLAYINDMVSVFATLGIIFALFALVMVGGWFYCKSHKYILTNRKVIIYKKFIFLTQREVTLSRITDMLMNVGIFGRLLNFGEIVPVSGAMEGAMAPSLNYSLKGVFNPIKVFDLLNELRIAHEEKGPEALIDLEFDEESIKLEELPKQIHLFPEEKVLMMLYRKYASIFFRIIWIVIVPIVLTFVLGFSYNSVLAISPLLGFMVYIIFIIMIVLSIIAILGLFIAYLYVRGHTYIITTHRVLMLRIFVVISYRELDFDDISDITLNQGPFARIFNYGTVKTLTYGIEFGLTTFLLSMDGVEDPNEVKPKVLELMRRFKEKKF